MSTKDRLRNAQEQVKAKQYAQAPETLKQVLRKKKPDPGALHRMAVIFEHTPTNRLISQK